VRYGGTTVGALLLVVVVGCRDGNTSEAEQLVVYLHTDSTALLSVLHHIQKFRDQLEHDVRVDIVVDRVALARSSLF
jgi:hypothetical protein